MEFIEIWMTCWMLLLNPMLDLWWIRYTAFSELLPLLALGALPLVKVEKITQEIDSNTLTIVNSTTLSSPFTTFSFSASAAFEVRSPSRIQVLLFFTKFSLFFRIMYVLRVSLISVLNCTGMFLTLCFFHFWNEKKLKGVPSVFSSKLLGQLVVQQSPIIFVPYMNNITNSLKHETEPYFIMFKTSRHFWEHTG